MRRRSLLILKFLWSGSNLMEVRTDSSYVSLQLNPDGHRIMWIWCRKLQQTCQEQMCYQLSLAHPIIRIMVSPSFKRSHLRKLIYEGCNKTQYQGFYLIFSNDSIRSIKNNKMVHFLRTFLGDYIWIFRVKHEFLYM